MKEDIWSLDYRSPDVDSSARAVGLGFKIRSLAV